VNVRVTVYGRGKPAGALAIGRGKGGRAFLHHRDGAELKDWKNAVRDKVGEGLTGEPYAGAVRVDAVFYFARPKGHYGTGGNRDRLKASAPAYPTTRANGDSDKLARALLDALTGVAIADDSQVVDLWIRKRYADGRAVSVDVEISSLDELDVLHVRALESEVTPAA
jgi:crossover junction endodeoxyribonuclease RusA